MSGTTVFLLILIAVSLVFLVHFLTLRLIAELDRRERRQKETERCSVTHLYYDPISSKLITYVYDDVFYTVYNSEKSVTYVYLDGAVDTSNWVHLGEL